MKQETRVPWWLMHEAGGNALRVYVALDAMNRQGIATSMPNIGVYAHLSDVTVHRAMRELLDLGAISREERWTHSGARLPNRYTLAGTTRLTPVVG